MGTNPNQAYYPSMYCTWYWGKHVQFLPFDKVDATDNVQ